MLLSLEQDPAKVYKYTASHGENPIHHNQLTISVRQYVRSWQVWQTNMNKNLWKKTTHIQFLNTANCNIYQ